MRLRKGFTLGELIVVIAIIGILSSLVMPSIINWIHKIKVKSFSEEILSDLEWARCLAFKKGSSKVEFQSDRYLIYVPENSTSPIKEKVAPEKIAIKANLDLEKTRIKFKRNKLPDTGGNIEIKDSESEIIYYKIVINSTSGRIYLEKIQ
ncbi:hypothetical protein Dester_1163 [Desulfurobacterium thermolithotrophum DSM 11699]|uniref:Prepilin-type N-terminal cleavage/methylation domain-containing protein n=1 Tax=Desulfurobacterium thermolithotrophum (strain DSM 11699 / BSA) TaxID=868864 RepID=F0S0C0_DESTD|nr:prepilin-type N-terminal cleavage/methylation domain-containing protein [Desulfurobacterium thermolithotrophum]ADY73799.1 hypothetical protein Dester_1163 [Desulfurobacterium thermolithotrophum DSM 11699]